MVQGKTGMFITFEGPEGSGKTAQLDPLADFLTGEGYVVRKTREPGGTPIGDQIRNTILDLKNTAMVDRTEALLLQASRAQLVEEVIKPGLERGEVILCDRFADSTLAYQGFGHQNDLTPLREIIHYATGGLTPDLTILLDIDPAVGLKRRNQAGNLNRLDALDLGFHQRVRKGYLELAGSEPERWVVIDADRSFQDVLNHIQEVVLERLRARRQA
ncbi:MAG: dTMP kinase [Anaerolineales bacterium]